jgi:hypothetical protein
MIMSIQETSADNRFSLVLIALFKGVVYGDDNPPLWQSLLSCQARIREYVSHLGLELVVFEDEGFAWLRTHENEEGENPLPRLVSRRQLSYPVSLLCALLRRRLAEHDAYSSERRLILDREEIVQMVRTFLAAGSNEAKAVDQIDAHLQKVIDLGYARRLRTDKGKIEVRRILKAFVDAQWLEEFDRLLEEYRGGGERAAGKGKSE